MHRKSHFQNDNGETHKTRQYWWRGKCAHIFALADTLRLKTLGWDGGGGGTEATEHTTKSKQTALSYELKQINK